jgi:hypothetical protein
MKGLITQKRKKSILENVVKHRIKFEIYYYYLIQQKGALMEYRNVLKAKSTWRLAPKILVMLFQKRARLWRNGFT